MLCTMGNYLMAQQIGMYSHYFYKPMAYNPAFTGTDEYTNAMLLSRSQWRSFKGAPQLTLFTADGNVMDKKVGIGLNLISDRKGITNLIGGSVYYAYHLSLNNDMQLSMGMSVGVADHSIDFSKAVVENPNDPTFYADAQHKTAFNANAGLVFNWKDLKIGLGVPQLIANKLKSVNYVDSSNITSYYNSVRHIMMSAHYKYVIIEDKGISIEPVLLTRIVPKTPFQFDATVNVNWKNKVWAGITYKSKYAIGLNIGVYAHERLRIGYSYDVITGNLGKYAGISHELMVNYQIVNKKESTQTPTNTLPPDNTEYQERLDKLQAQLKKNQQKLKELNDKLDKQASQPVATNQGGKPGMMNSDGIFVTPKADFKDSKGQVAQSGYYIIVGIFFYLDFAEEEIKNFKKKGFAETDLIYSESKKNHYVFAYKVATKEEALAKEKELNGKDSSNAWILNLTD